MPFLWLDLSQASAEDVLEMMATHTYVEKSKTFIPDPKFSEVGMKTSFYGCLMILMCLYVPVQNRFLRLRSYQLLSGSLKPPRLRQLMNCLCIFKPNQCVTSFLSIKVLIPAVS